MATAEGALERVRGICLSLPSTREGRHFGETAFYVKGRIFATCGEKSGACEIVFGLEPGRRADLLRKDSRFRPYPRDRRGVVLDAAQVKGWGEVEALLRESYDLMKPPPAKRAGPGKGRARPVKLLSGGNPQIAKGDGDAPVQAYIAAMPGWKQDVGRRLDALIARSVPGARKAVKWNSPFYGVEGRGWFLSIHVFTRYVKVGFFRGTSLRPLPPGASKVKGMRTIDIREGDDLDEARMANWVQQAAALPGWEP